MTPLLGISMTSWCRGKGFAGMWGLTQGRKLVINSGGYIQFGFYFLLGSPSLSFSLYSLHILYKLFANVDNRCILAATHIACSIMAATHLCLSDMG